MNILITASATKKEVTNPVSRITASEPVIFNPFLSKEYMEAAAIVGIAKKKENSAASTREAPSNIAPIMVAAEREVPGIMARV